MEKEKISGRPILFYFQVHQPRRLKEFQFLDINQGEDYFDDTINERIVKDLSDECYLPVNRMLIELIKNNPEVRICFSISGVVLDQFEKYVPDVLKSFKELAETGCVEFLAAPYYHSLAWKISESEFQTQVIRQVEKIHHYFGLQASAFVNSEMIYNDEIGSMISRMGFNGVLTDAAGRFTKSGDGDFLFRHPEEPVSVLLRQTRLSEDVVHRFGAGMSVLKLENYTDKIHDSGESPLLIGMSYETFGGFHKKDTGITEFLRDLLTEIVRDDRLVMVHPSSLFQSPEHRTSLSIKEPVSWTDEQKDISAWLGNELQVEAFNALKALEPAVTNTSDEALLDTWRQLQTCDHFYYMSTKKISEGSFHTYFSHYASPYEAYINYMNILGDLTSRIKVAPVKESEEEHAKTLEYNRQHPSTPVWAMKREGNMHRHI